MDAPGTILRRDPGCDRISITAHFTAQVWAREGLPWAACFDTSRGRWIHRLMTPSRAVLSRLGYTTLPQRLVQRHRILNALVEQLRPVQLIELGAGLSPRGLTFSQTHAAAAIDVDLPAMIAYKRERLPAELPPGYRLAGVDLVRSEDYFQDIGANVAGPTVVVSEGLLNYFPLDVQRRLLGRIVLLLRACGGGTFLYDTYHQADIDRLGVVGQAMRRFICTGARTRDAELMPDGAASEHMLREAGFDAVTLHRVEPWQQRLHLAGGRRESAFVLFEAAVAPV